MILALSNMEACFCHLVMIVIKGNYDYGSSDFFFLSVLIDKLYYKLQKRQNCKREAILLHLMTKNCHKFLNYEKKKKCRIVKNKSWTLIKSCSSNFFSRFDTILVLIFTFYPNFE